MKKAGVSRLFFRARTIFHWPNEIRIVMSDEASHEYTDAMRRFVLLCGPSVSILYRLFTPF
jgi:hypothetical protein